MESKKNDNVDLEKNDTKDEGGEKNEKKNDTKDEGGEENEKKNDVNSNLKSLAGPMKKVCGDAFKIASEISNY